MRRSLIILLLSTVLLLLLLPSPASAVEANQACLDCHSAAGAAPVKAIFDVPPVDTAKCNTCHWYGVHDFDSAHAGSVYDGYMGQQCNSCHHASDTWPFRPQILPWPAVYTPAGWFQSADSVLASAGAVHAIHANGSWLKNNGDCASCHGAAACDACHEAPDTTHVEHATIGAQQVPVTWTIGKKYGDAATDTYLYSYVPTGNYDGASAMYVGAPRAGREQRMILRFPLARLGSTPVTTATIELTRASGVPYALRAYRLRRADVSATQATWNVYRTGAAWGVAGAKSAATDYYDTPYAESSTGLFDVTALLAAAKAEGATSLDLVIADPAPVAGRYNGFYSANGAYAEWYPRLRLEGYNSLNMYAYGPVGGTEVGDPAEPVTPTPERTCVASACHDLTKAATPEFSPTCVSCHVDTHHYALHEATALTDDCKTCHQTNLQPEHYRDSSSSAPRGCANCHPTPVNGLFEPWAKGCSQAGALHLGAGCHDPRGLARPHGHIDQSHTVDPAAAACTASGCHDGGLAVEHENASVTDTSGTRTGCNVCHTPYTMPSTTNCITCHPEKVDGEGNVIDHGFSATAHTSIDATTSGTWTMALAPTATLAGQLLNAPYPYSLNCSVCHDLRLDTEHAKATAAPVNPSVCTDCHPTPRDSITGAWDKSCTTAGCHATPSNSHGTTAPLDPHKVAASLTTCTPDGVGCSATPGLDSYARTTCHTTDLVQEHNRKIGGFNPYPTQAIAKTISVSCQQCHTSEAYASLNGSWDGTCDACHDGTALPNHSIAGTARYDEVHALHEASRYYDSGFTSSTGVRVAGTNAMDAHGPLRTALSNTRYIPYGCGLNICHTQFWVAAGLDGYYRANLCADCHGPNIAPIPAYQGSYTWKSGAYSDGYSYTTALTLDLAPITLPPASSLDFKTYYNIETDWDYGYVQVSTDNGATWTNLAGTGTTTTNPNGQNLGNGITGSSGGEWRDAHFDLSAYAGQVVKLRFNYVCDPYTYGDGWFLDVLTVGPAGSPVFVDDVETLKPEWTVTSNRTTKWSR